MSKPPSKKKSRVITAESSPNFLSLPLNAFPLEALLTLQREVPKQIERYLALQEQEKNAPPPAVPVSDWIDISDVDRNQLQNDDTLMVKLWQQRHAQFPDGHRFSRPTEGKRACSSTALQNQPDFRFSAKENKIYCLTCVLANGTVSCDDGKICFVTEGFDDFANFDRRAKSHINAQKTYRGNLHKKNVQVLEGRLARVSGKPSVAQQASVPIAVETSRNKYVLTRILQALFWLGCQGLAIRGLKDERSNFITLLWMWVNSDSILRLHLETNEQLVVHKI